ncbi:MAG: AAA family ATPase [Microbacterium gubbeenense]|uniref:AAA family ATPase n=1 Tax=Microbacterium gubbeenense TaxID=159896 RepID=UPI003F9D628F
MSRTIRKPTGLPSWPVLLLAGFEKAGKSYSAAEASSSDLIGETYWISFGEQDPDAYGAIPGARFNIVEHDGSLGDMVAAIQDAKSQPRGDKPNMLVIDSASKVWMAISAWVDAAAAQRNKRDRHGELVVGTDLWNKANTKWQSFLNMLRGWDGPVILTARMDLVTVMDDRGLPTRDKTNKIKAQKSLPYDVDAIVEMPTRGQATLAGARSVIYQIPERADMPGFTVDGLWRKLGLDKHATAKPTYTEAPPAQADEPGAPKITIPES